MAHQDYWKVDLCGGLSIIRPDGSPVEFASHKCDALAAWMVINQQSGVAREDAQQILWPNRKDALQRSSLRQALFKIKSALGSENCQFTRDRLSLLWTLDPQCDAALVGAQKTEALLKRVIARGPMLVGFEEGPFRLLRQKYLAIAPSQLAVKSAEDPTRIQFQPIECFRTLLKWSLDQDPSKALELMKSQRYLTVDLNKTELEQICTFLLGQIEHQNPLYGWILLWKAMADNSNRGLLPGFAGFARAKDYASAHQDNELEIEANYELACTAVLIGNTTVAQVCQDRTVHLSTMVTDRVLLGRAQDIIATSLIHSENPKAAFPYLEAMVDSYSSTVVERYTAEALEALYKQIFMPSDKADVALQQLASDVKELHNARIDSIILMASAICMSKAGEFDSAHALLDELHKKSLEFNNKHFQIYALEHKAAVFYRQGDKGMAQKYFDEGKKVRNSMGIRFDHWDMARLRDLPIRKKG